MAEFILGRIKFVYRNNWATGTAYVVDDVVTAGGRTYICISNHTSAVLFETDYDPIPELSKWNLVADGQQWRGDWVASTYYNSGDLVKWGGIVYQCNTAHTSATYVSPTWLGLEQNSALWDVFATSFNWSSAWAYNTRYKVNDLVTYGGYTYVCTEKHISAPTTATLNATGFTVGAGTATLTYATQVVAPYAVGSTVTLAGFDPAATSTPSNINTTHTVVSCTTTQLTFALTGTYTVSTLGTVSGSSKLGLEKDSDKWDSFNEGIVYLGDWVTNTRYRTNDIVKWGADLWICLTPHLSSDFIVNTAYWEIFVSGFQFENSWDIATTYQIGDVVTYGGYSYVSKTNNVGLIPTTNTSDWAVYTTGFSFQGDWASNISYKIGSVVRNGGYTYLSLLDSPSITAEATDTDSATDIITVSSTAGFVAGMQVVFDTTFGGLTAGVKYYVLAAGLDTTEFKVSLTPGGTPVALTDTTSQTVDLTVTPYVQNTTYWVKLNSGLQWTNNTTTYTEVSGTNVDSLGSGAKFDVVRSSTIYSITVSTGFGGSTYAPGDTIKILGTSVGGISPVNDVLITVDTVLSGAITSVSWVGISSTWKAGTVYTIGDLVLFGANNYICVSDHAATLGSRPDNDVTALYWNLFSAGAESASLTTTGDTFYYGPNGPTRLPIGADGQVLRVSGGYPIWETYGHIFNTVFVSPTGTDAPYPASGFSIDQPWKTIRYACKQVEDGYRDPQAKALLQKNKHFLIKEVNNYIIYTYRASVSGTGAGAFLTGNTNGLNVNMPIKFTSLTGSLTIGGSPIDTNTTYYIKTINPGINFTISGTAGGVTLGAGGTGTAVAIFSYDSEKAERDAAYIVEGLTFDLSHGGTQKTTENTLSFYDVTGTEYITAMTGYQIQQFIGSHQYLKILIANVLKNTPPAINYQTLNSVVDVVYQNIDLTFTAEEDSTVVVQGLLDILIDGLTAGNTAGVPRALNPNTTINVKTGTYTEVLPIVVPANTAVVGDELRSTVVQPKPANDILVNDKSKTISSLNRVRDLISDIVLNVAVTPSSGNTAVQKYLTADGSTGSITAVERVVNRVEIVYDIVNTGFGAIPAFQFSTPTNYNTAGLTNVAYASTGYATGNTLNFNDGKTQLTNNYDFIIADTLQYYANGSYSALWAATTTEGRDKGKRDIRYILDAIQHDMTYGGNYQSLIAGSSYYSSYLLNISAAEKPAFLDLFGFMKTLIGKIVRKEAITAQVGNTVARVNTGTAGSAAAGAFAEDRVQNVIDWLDDGESPASVAPYYGWASADLQTAYAAIQAKRTEIALDATGWVQKYYQNVALDLDLTTRDAGLIIDAVALDMVLGTNFNSMSAGRAYLRGTTSTEALLNGPIKNPTLGAINFMKYKIKNIAASGAAAQLQTTIDDITKSISGGVTPRINYPTPVLPSATYSAVAGTNLTGTGTSATFNFVRSVAGFTASVNAGGSGYVVGNTIRILGSAIGGATPANDIVLTVASVSTTAVSTVTVSTFNDAVVLLEDNRTFILEEVVAYINFTYPSLVYDRDLTRRDTGYILDALHYDLTYGGDFASQQAGQAYWSFGNSQISAYVKTAVLASVSRLSTVVQSVVQSSAVSATSGNSATQLFKGVTQTAGSALAATTIASLVTKIYNYIDLGLTAGAPVITITAVATNNTFTSNAHGLSNGDLVEPQTTPSSGQGGFGLVADTTYYVVNAATNTFQLAATYNGTAIATFTNGTGLSLVAHDTNMPYIGWVSSDLRQQYSTLSAETDALQDSVITFIDSNYQNLVYDEALARRDSGKAIDAVSFDLMFNSNFRSTKAGQSYNRPQSSVLKGRLYSSTTESLKYLQTQITTEIAANPTAVTRANYAMHNIVAHIRSGSGETPEMNGTVMYNNNNGIINGANILRENIDFLAHESTAWVNASFGGTVTTTADTGELFTTSATHNLEVGDPVRFTFTPITVVATATVASTKKITLTSVAGIVVGMPIVFSGTVFGGVQAATPYYVQSIAGSDITISLTNGGAAQIVDTDATGVMGVTVGGVIGGVVAEQIYYVLTTPSITTFTVTETQFSSTVKTLSDMTGSMQVKYAFDEVACRRDMSEFLNALVYDLQYTGNYKSKRAAELYLNAVNGSELSNMWLVRNSTGVRNMTLSGLSGPLSVPNEYGTKRPEGGAYTSLDPGFGPYDSNAWVNSRSCYVQNCSLFGVGATALKIDGALHAGGNRSIVANDYTTFISDGIGVWCTGANSLTELVSVFAYYSYAGYIAELGGRIRATNGNSSYGTYGVIAEGTDTYEVPLYANLNNRGEDAYITNVVTDGADEVLRIEFANAGTNYTNASWTVSGSGFNAAATGDEFRDYGVFETRLIDLDDGYGYGGTGYLTAANAAQLSAVGYITIAAADGQLSTAYTGMRVVITAGTGAGQFAAILTYNNGSKVAKVYQESFTNLTVTGSTDAGDTLTVASTATLYANMPIYLGSAIGGLLANTLYYVRSGFTATTFTVSTTSGGAAEPVTATTTGQTVTLYAAGWDSVVPGKTIENNLDLTTTYIIEPRITYSAPGYTSTARTLATSATWQAVTYAANTFLAIPTGSTATTYSVNGTTWSGAGNLPSATTWVDVAYGGGEGATATAIVGGLGGVGAQLEAVLGEGLTAGQVVSVNVIEGGFGYLTPPTIEFVSATGSGATGTAIVLDGAITGITMDITGSGYLTAPTVNVRTDVVTGITVNFWGKNYTSAPTVTISNPGGVTTSSWSATTSVSNGQYLITDTNYIYLVTGSGTTGAAKPTHLSGAVLNGTATLTFYGRLASGTAVLTNNGVSSITVGSGGGLGYTTVPTVTILDTNAKFITIPTTASAGTTKAAYQTVSGATTAAAWSQSSGSLPNGSYASIAYGLGYWVAIGGTATATRSFDGNTWNTVTIATLGAGTYSSLAYGNGYFVGIATGSNATVVSSTSGNSWAAGGNMPSTTTWTSIAYGNGRFVAIASGSKAVAYSINNGTSWLSSPAGLPSSLTWTKITYGQGLFLAIASGTSSCATSPDGVTWTLRTMPSSSAWKGAAFGNPTIVGNGVSPIFVAVSNTSGQIGASIRTGATTQGRIEVSSGVVAEIRVTEPGSGYPRGLVTATTTSTNVITTSDTTNLVALQPVEFTGLDAYGLITDVTYYVTTGSIVANTSFKVSADVALATAGTAVNLTSGSTLTGSYRAGPIVTQVDPNKTRTAATRVRMGVGALGNPSFSNRGTANTTATANVTGDGYADLYQASNFINVSGLYAEPTAGANVEFASIPGVWFKLVAVNNLLGTDGNYTATFQINPSLSVLNAPAHNDRITTRLKYSQVRLTGHDFLYIGTGGTASTNYPEVDVSSAITANQSLSSNGGRVFFTSTDQDGNFNVGNLFGVQQATGTATLNASAFNLSGLQSLQLGTVSVGAGSAVITSFSTDPYFTANSDNILPTQKAIKSYITAQIGGGQSSLNVNTLTSGVIYVANNTISTTTGVQINVKAKMYFTGGVDGAPVALVYFMQK